jgi:hypothetical protein
MATTFLISGATVYWKVMKNIQNTQYNPTLTSTKPITSQSIPRQVTSVTTANGINYTSLQLMNSTKGLLDGSRYKKPLLLMLVIGAVAILVLKKCFFGSYHFVCLFGLHRKVAGRPK